MIDYIKAKFNDKDKVQSILISEDKFKLKAKYDLKGNTLHYPIRCSLDTFNINISQYNGFIENSLHKYYNMLLGRGQHNGDDFTHEAVIDALNALETSLGYDLDNTILNNLEFGFNIDIEINPSKFLEKHVLMYKFKSPCYNPKNDKSMKIKKFSYQEYDIKLYNKSLHLGNKCLTDTILRVEVKYKTKKQFNKFGIYSLNDLKNPSCILKLYEDYLAKLSELTIVDSFNGCFGMKKKEQQKFTLFTNPNYWNDTRRNFCTSTLQNRKNEFQEMIFKYEQNKWFTTLFKKIDKKFYELYNLETINNPIYL
ncbi:hypothetical protein AB9K26_12845 [Psychroserpens sp. XS_ASV72]|uniref:hypothetical protein n=1 Tax=Psychroserpens sp. XS_ASV72 TaxID=3241293 RepID=UPI00351943EB